MGKTRIDPETIMYNIETIIDIIVFLVIIFTAIFTIKKRKKDDDGKGQNYIEDKNGTNDEKGLIMEEIQQNVKKYKDFKQLLTALNSIPALIICPIILGFCLYGIMTDKPDTISPIYLIIFFVLLLVYIFIFKNSKRVLDKLKNNFLYKIIIICAVMFIVMITAGIGLIAGSIICEKLKLNARLSLIVIAFSFFFGAALGLYFIAKINKKNSHKKIGNIESTNKDTINDKTINNKETYDELRNNNRKVEGNTGFHQSSLLK